MAAAQAFFDRSGAGLELDPAYAATLAYNAVEYRAERICDEVGQVFYVAFATNAGFKQCRRIFGRMLRK